MHNSTCTPNFTYFDSPEFLKLSLHLLTAFSTPFYCLGIYCILFKTPLHMNPVKWYLLSLHLSITLFDYSITLFTVPYILMPELAGIMYGGLRLLNLPNFVALIVIFFLCCVVFCTLSMFEHRFFVLCEFRVKKYWSYARKPWLLWHYALLVGCFVPALYMMPDQEEAKKIVFARLPCLPKEIYAEPLLTAALDYRFIVISCVLGGLGYITELSIFVINMIISGRAQLKSMRISQKTYQMHKQFFIALVIQTAIPSVTLFVPLGCAYVNMAIGSYNQANNNFGIITITFHGLLATVVMLTVHQPYRLAVLGLFKKQMRRTKSIAVVSVSGMVV